MNDHELRQLHSRLTTLISDTAQTAPGLSDEDAGVHNPATVADAILTNPQILGGIAQHHARTAPMSAPSTVLAAIAVVDRAARTYPDNYNARRLPADLSALARRVEAQRDEDTMIGTAYMRLVKDIDACLDAAGVGAVIRAAVTATGATLTPGPAPAPATATEEK
ncbi:hypothetical protein [Nocardia farcinica]